MRLLYTSQWSWCWTRIGPQITRRLWGYFSLKNINFISQNVVYNLSKCYFQTQLGSGCGSRVSCGLTSWFVVGYCLVFSEPVGFSIWDWTWQESTCLKICSAYPNTYIPPIITSIQVYCTIKPSYSSSMMMSSVFSLFHSIFFVFFCLQRDIWGLSKQYTRRILMIE
jgi:hypothetical protein